MEIVRCAVSLALVCATAGATVSHAAANGPAQTSALKILVIAGEDSINIIQQKTAVAPIVEVRDQNNLPVSGASVTFAIGGGRTAAFGNGARTLTVTTDGAGRAGTTSLNPIGTGRVQIQVRAEFQGERASTTITQTNVATAAAAASVVSAAGVGTAAGGGGGLSGTAIGAIVGGVGGGALIAAKAVGGGSTTGDAGALGASGSGSSGSPGSSGGTPTPNPTPPSTGQTTTTYSGPLAGQLVVTMVGTTNGVVTSTCVSTRVISATMFVMLQPAAADGTVTGTARTDGTMTEISITASPLCSPLPGTPFNDPLSSVTGTVGGLSCSGQGGVSAGSIKSTTTFSGTLNSGVISGTLNYTVLSQNPIGGNVYDYRGAVTLSVVLR